MTSKKVASAYYLQRAQERITFLEAKLNEARDRVHELEAKLEAATNVIIDLTPYPTTEEADAILIAAGFDPAAVGARGEEIVKNALDKFSPETCTHEWKETYYGVECKHCKLFYPSGSEPWLPVNVTGSVE